MAYIQNSVYHPGDSILHGLWGIVYIKEHFIYHIGVRRQQYSDECVSNVEPANEWMENECPACVSSPNQPPQ